MMKKIVTAAIATATLALTAPVAHAGVQADCGMVARETSPDHWEGYAWGYAASDTAGASISVSCEVWVNGGAVDSTPPGPSGQASATAGDVSYNADDNDSVSICASVTGSESGGGCSPYTPVPSPTSLCALLVALVTDVPPYLVVTNEGDVYVLGVRVVDCPIGI